MYALPYPDSMAFHLLSSKHNTTPTFLPSPTIPSHVPFRLHHSSSLMFRRTSLAPERAHGRNIRLEPLLLRAICPRGQLDQRVQWHLHPGTLLLWHVHVIGVDAPQHGLMRHDDDILTALQFHDDGLKPDDDVAV